MGMVLDLFLKEDSGYRTLKVPREVVEDLLSDRLCAPDVERILRLASPVTVEEFKAGSVVVDMTARTATCFHAKLDTLGATWLIEKPEVTLENY